MKKLFLIILLVPTIGWGRGFIPRWEISMSTDANSFSTSTGSSDYVTLAIRPGFYIMEGLSIEPEAFWGVAKTSHPELNYSGNLSYGYGMGHNMVVPFVLAGYGAGNGVPFNQPISRSATFMTGIRFFNAGAGLKVMAIGGRALFRLEYRYQDFMMVYHKPYSHMFARRVLFGVAVLL